MVEITPNTFAEFQINNTEETKSGGWSKSVCGLSHYLSHYQGGNQKVWQARGNGSNDRQNS